MYSGITSREADERLKQFGYNELPSAKPKNFVAIAREVMKEPMFLLLIGCGALYMILGDYKEGTVLSSTILVIISITFYQYRKTERALDALKQLSSPRVVVIRDGKKLRISGREVVPDDLLILNEGDRIPADALIIETTNFQVDESLLTGESMPVSKYPEGGHDTLFSGTLAIQGRCSAWVTKTGLQSQLGKIAMSLNIVDDSPTRLQGELKVLIRRFAIIGVFVSLSVILAFYLTRGNILKSILLGLASAMAILPEEFPVILTIFLALGAWRLSKKNVLTRKPSAIETLGSATVLCSDKTGTMTQNKMTIVEASTTEGYVTDISPSNQQIIALVKIARLASQKDTIDPMDTAINELAASMGIPQDGKVPVKEYPLSRQLLAVTRIYKDDSGNFIAMAKGAPEAIFKLCKMTTVEMLEQEKNLNRMTQAGFRVLGVAEGISSNILQEEQSEIGFNFVGLLAFEDPIRPEVPQAIKDCHSAGIKVIMVTGDHPATARTIAHKAGLATDIVITGDQLSAMTDTELQQRIKEVNIFARIVPEHKLRIIKALKDNGEIVAMTGDGVNDAPALKAADIGIAMAAKGTDVAREASSLVLLDDNFASVVAGIRLGRRIFDNMQKAMSYVLAIHIPIIGLTLLPAFFSSLPLLLLPLHIVFMELIIDPVCSVAFESEQEELGIMNRPPRAINKKFFGVKRITYSFLEGVLLLMVVLVVYFLSIKEGHSEQEIRAIAFSALILGNVFLILTNLSSTRPFWSVFTEGNYAAVLILCSAIILLLAVISVPQLQHLFSFSYPGYSHFIISISGASVMLAILEAIKYVRRKQMHWFDAATQRAKV